MEAVAGDRLVISSGWPAPSLQHADWLA